MVFAVAQYFYGVFSWLLLHIFTDFKIEGLANLDQVKNPFVLVANHESHLDPTLSGVALLSRPSLMPLRFMGKNELFRIPVFNLFFWLLGGFKANRGQGIGKSLLTPVKILEKGGAVMMFPEGKIIHERPQLGEGRRGAAILALTTRAAILPMSIHTPAKFSLSDFLFKRRPIVIRIGEPFYLNNLDYPDFSDENMAAATRIIMKKIADLYFQHQY